MKHETIAIVFLLFYLFRRYAFQVSRLVACTPPSRTFLSLSHKYMFYREQEAAQLDNWEKGNIAALKTHPKQSESY